MFDKRAIELQPQHKGKRQNVEIKDRELHWNNLHWKPLISSWRVKDFLSAFLTKKMTHAGWNWPDWLQMNVVQKYDLSPCVWRLPERILLAWSSYFSSQESKYEMRQKEIERDRWISRFTENATASAPGECANRNTFLFNLFSNNSIHNLSVSYNTSMQ